MAWQPRWHTHTNVKIGCYVGVEILLRYFWRCIHNCVCDVVQSSWGRPKKPRTFRLASNLRLHDSELVHKLIYWVIRLLYQKQFHVTTQRSEENIQKKTFSIFSIVMKKRRNILIVILLTTHPSIRIQIAKLFHSESHAHTVLYEWHSIEFRIGAKVNILIDVAIF